MKYLTSAIFFISAPTLIFIILAILTILSSCANGSTLECGVYSGVDAFISILYGIPLLIFATIGLWWIKIFKYAFFSKPDIPLAANTSLIQWKLNRLHQKALNFCVFVTVTPVMIWLVAIFS